MSSHTGLSLLIRQLLRGLGPVDKLLRRRGSAPCSMHQDELAPSYVPVLACEAAISNHAMTTNPGGSTSATIRLASGVRT